MAPAPNVGAMQHSGGQYNVPPRSFEVFRILDPNVEASIPSDVREQFHRDSEGRLLFFAAASRTPLPPKNLVADQYAGLGHSVSYLAGIDELRAERQRKRKERDEAQAREAADTKKHVSEERHLDEDDGREDGRLLADGLLAWAKDIDKGTKAITDEMNGWEDVKKESVRERPKAVSA
jgi:chromatin structure-remodeling complex subunit RSC1/2